MTLLLWILPSFIGLSLALDCSNVVKYTNQWGTGLDGKFEFTAPDSATNGWNIGVVFNKDMPWNGMTAWNGDNNKCTGTWCYFTDKGWNKNVAKGKHLLHFKLLYLNTV